MGIEKREMRIRFIHESIEKFRRNAICYRLEICLQHFYKTTPSEDEDNTDDTFTDSNSSYELPVLHAEYPSDIADHISRNNEEK